MQISENTTISFRVINPTSQPVTIYRRTNLGQLTMCDEPPVVATLNQSTQSNVNASTSEQAEVSIDLNHTDLTDEHKSQLFQLLEANRDVIAVTDTN